MKARIARAWPLWSILAAQAVLTLPWLWRTAPFSDEALYIDAGHQEWAHWLHHAVIQDYPSWFSGSAVLYPPLAAAADSVGGLPAARMLSLIFLLATSAVVCAMGTRLFGRSAGLFGCLLFAVCGIVVHAGALATFDPQALFLLVLAGWAGTRIADGGSGWLVACAAALVAANVTKYATLAWDPLVFSVIVLCGWPALGRRALGLAMSVAATVGVIDLGLLMLAGPDYARGLIVTTVFRSIRTGPSSSSAGVLLHAAALTGLILLPAIAGVIMSIGRKAHLAGTVLLGLFVLAALLAPLEQARLHQVSSLDRNMGFGLAFAAIGAGYALSTTRKWLASRYSHGKLTAAAAVVALVLAVAMAGRVQKVQFRGPGIALAMRVVNAIKPGYRHGTIILSDGAAGMEQYYLPGIPAGAWQPTFNPSRAQSARIAAQICTGQISVVVLRQRGDVYDHPYDRRVVRLMGRTRRFALALQATGGQSTTRVWALRASGGRAGCR